MAYAGLETLFQNLGPTQASWISGEREGTARGLDQLTAQKEQEAILAAQEANRQAQIMNPLAAQFKQGEIAAQGAQLPGLAATSRLKGTEADIADATKSGVIGKANSDNDLAVQANKLKEMTNRQQMSNQIISQIMAQGPAAESYRKQLEAQHPEIAQMLGGVPTNQLIAAQAHANEWLNSQSAAFQQALMTATKQKESHLAGISMQNKTQKDLEQMRIDAGKYDKKGSLSIAVDDRLYKAKTPIEKAEILESAYHAAQDNGDQESAAKYAMRALEARKRAAEDAANRGLAKPAIDVGAATGMATTPAPAATAPIAGNKGFTEGTTKSGVKFKVIPSGSGG